MHGLQNAPIGLKRRGCLHDSPRECDNFSYSCVKRVV